MSSSTRSKKSSRAPDAAAAAAAQPQQERRRSRSREPKGSLSENNLGNAAAADKAALLEEEVQFWSLFETILVVTWLKDYEGHGLKEKDADKREIVINLMALLVVTKGAKRPDGAGVEQQLKVLQDHFSSQHPRAKQPLPGFVVDPASAALLAAKPPASSVSDDVGDEPSSEDEDMPDVRNSQPSGRRTPDRRILPPYLKSPGHESVTTSADKLVKSPGGEGLRALCECLSCCADRPLASYGRPGWICPDCGRRGDLPTCDPVNLELRRGFEAEQRIRLSLPRGDQSELSVSLGQFKGDTRAAVASGSANDRACLAQIQMGLPSPLFIGEGATLPVKHEVALEHVRKALHGQTYERPSVPLVSLVRAGKLLYVGWAVPRKPQADSGTETLQVSSSGELAITSSRKGQVSTGCASVQQFMAAMFSTIIPALVDKPVALMQWIVLGRTALELEQQYDWSTASRYLEQVLQERVPLGQPLDFVSNDALTSIQHSRSLARTFPSSAASSSSFSSSLPHDRQVCNNYQRGKCDGGCGRRHVCAVCEGKDHTQRDCPRASSRGYSPAQRSSGQKVKVPQSGASRPSATMPALEPAAKAGNQ